MTLVPGRELSHYRLITQIGEGGMGVVWRATDTTLGRDVAIKVLPALFAADPERMARFEREARLLASLNHPHIASIYGVGLADGVRFLAMELVEGDDLAARIARGPVSVAEAIEMARQIAEALEAAHEKGVIHRDLKPANVKLTAEGQVKVLDFGLAKALEGETGRASDATAAHSPTITSPMTAANVILGTAAYMSPEQARGKIVDRRADIWAFGCVLYECLTGRRAFSGETVSDTIAKVLEREPDFAALPGATPPRVRELLQRCLDKEPRHRLRDIGDARIALEEVLASRSSSGRLLLKDAGAEAATGRGGSKTVPILSGLAGLVAGAALWFLLGPQAHEAETRCVTLTMPADIVVQGATLSRDGGTLLVLGQPRVEAGAQSPPPRIYARQLDRFDFKQVAGTEGATGIHSLSDASLLYMFTPIAPGSPQFRLAKIPYDGSAPATTVVELKNSWAGLVPMLKSGDLLTREGPDKLVRIGSGGQASAPLKMDAGRPGVSSYTLGPVLPGDHAMLVSVISYDARGWHYSVGVLDIGTAKVKIVEEDGGNPRYTPTGHLVFARGDALLAVPFDLGRLEPRGTPVAVWSGLSTQFSFTPGFYGLTRDGSLFYRPGQVGGDRSLAVLDASGKLAPWSSERRAMDNRPELSPDGRRFVCSLVSSRGIDELWVSRLDTPGFERIGSEPDADAALYIWSPDGSRIAYFRSGKDGRDGIYVRSVDGGEGSLVFKHDEYVPVGWLPDGASLVVLRRGAEKGSLALLKLAGDAADTTRVHPIMTDAANLFGARLSPDGHHLAYTSDETGTPNAYVVELRPDGSTSRPVQVRTDQAFELQWAPNGNALYIRDQRNRVMKATMPSGPALAFPAAVEVWDLDKLGISLWTVLPDGRMLAGLKNDNESDLSQYNLVLNWTAELKRKLSQAH